MKATEKKAAQGAQVMESANAQTLNNTQAQAQAATYLQRMQANKNLLVGSLSKLFADIRKHTICPDVIAIEKNDFARFRAYMIQRHKLEEGASPKKGWSVWYGLQWYEKEIKRVANIETHECWKKANNYLRITRAALQEKAAKDKF
jgi:hypothetical protein